MAIHPRRKKFLEELPKHGNKILPAAQAAGFSESYARARGKTIYKTAVKEQVQEIAKMVENKDINKAEVKRMMADIVGLSPDVIMERLRNIATQEKDYSSALKVLAVLAREFGVEMDTDAPKVTIPVLNVSLKPRQASPNEGRTISIVGDIDEASDMGPSGGSDGTSEPEDALK